MLSKDLVNLILDYTYVEYEFISFVKENLDKVDWGWLSWNPNAIQILEQNPDKVNWEWFSRIRNAIHILEKNFDKAFLGELGMYIKQHVNKPSLRCPSLTFQFIHFFEENPYDAINWNALSKNPHAISILDKNLDKVNWTRLSQNPDAIPILEKNLDRVDWNELSQNPTAIHLLEQNLDKVNWVRLSKNPSIFTPQFRNKY